MTALSGRAREKRSGEPQDYAIHRPYASRKGAALFPIACTLPRFSLFSSFFHRSGIFSLRSPGQKSRTSRRKRERDKARNNPSSTKKKRQREGRTKERERMKTNVSIYLMDIEKLISLSDPAARDSLRDNKISRGNFYPRSLPSKGDYFVPNLSKPRQLDSLLFPLLHPIPTEKMDQSISFEIVTVTRIARILFAGITGLRSIIADTFSARCSALSSKNYTARLFDRL